jgi:hypothetical protein
LDLAVEFKNKSNFPFMSVKGGWQRLSKVFPTKEFVRNAIATMAVRNIPDVIRRMSIDMTKDSTNTKIP